MSVDGSDEDRSEFKEEKRMLFAELKPHLEPVEEGSTLMVPKADCEANIARAWIRNYMQLPVRILCTDDRLFEGDLHCVDSQGNIIIQSGQWVNAGFKGDEKKPVGLCLLTKKWIKKVYFRELNPDELDDQANEDNDDIPPLIDQDAEAHQEP